MALVVKNPPANAGGIRVAGLIPGLERFPWRRAWQPTPVFFAGESQGQRSLACYSPWGSQSQTQLNDEHRHPYTNLAPMPSSMMSGYRSPLKIPVASSVSHCSKDFTSNRPLLNSVSKHRGMPRLSSFSEQTFSNLPCSG